MYFRVRIDFTCLCDYISGVFVILQLHGKVIGSEILSVPTLFMLQLLGNNMIVSLPDVLIPLPSRSLLLGRYLPQWLAAP